MGLTTKELSYIWVDSFINLSYSQKELLFSVIEDEPKILDAIKRERDLLIDEFGEDKFNTIINSANGEYLKENISKLQDNDIFPVCICSSDYPKNLLEIQDPPLVLYCKGDIKLLNTECFSIVGSRHSLPVSLGFTEDYVKGLKDHFTLVTGIAEGVDKVVLTSAIKENAKVISVICGGFDKLYPSAHNDLMDSVKKVGLVISEQPLGVSPMPHMFPIRNRIIAGLSNGVLIVSGSNKSGVLHTYNYAVEYGKEVFAIPYTPNVNSGLACLKILKDGGILTENYLDILSYFGMEDKSKKVKLNEIEEKIINVIKTGEMHVEKIANTLNKEVKEISPILSMLEIKGVVIKVGVNAYGLKMILED